MREGRLSAENATFLFFLGIILLFLGVFAIIFGLLPANRVEGAGVIIIGPFPIILQGEVDPLILLAITFLPILLFMMAVLWFMRKFAESRVEDEEE